MLRLPSEFHWRLARDRLQSSRQRLPLRRRHRHAIISRLAALFSATTTVFPGAVSILITTDLDAGPAAVACQNARRSVVIAYPASTLSDNDLPVLDSKTTGICIGQR